MSHVTFMFVVAIKEKLINKQQRVTSLDCERTMKKKKTVDENEENKIERTAE